MNDGSSTAVGVLKDSETSQSTGISASAMTTKFAVADAEVDLLDGLRAVRVPLRDFLEFDLRHQDITPSLRRR